MHMILHESYSFESQNQMHIFYFNHLVNFEYDILSYFKRINVNLRPFISAIVYLHPGTYFI